MKDDAAQAAGLVASMNALAKSNRRVRAYVVFQEGEGQQDAIKKLAADKDLLIPLTYPKLAVSLKHLKIDPEAHNTLILYREKRIVRNSVNVTPETFAPIAAAAKKLVRR